MAAHIDSSFYVTGGTLRQDAACYVERQADKDLLDGLLKGEFCYVLTSRQMGKSSLMVRTAGKLREQGLRVAVLDLTAVGQPESKEQWYFGLLTRLGVQTRREDELEEFWLAHLLSAQFNVSSVRFTRWCSRRPLQIVSRCAWTRSLNFT